MEESWGKIIEDSDIRKKFKPLPIILGDERVDELLSGVTNAILEGNYGSWVEELGAACDSEGYLEDSLGGYSGSNSRINSRGYSGGNSGDINTYPWGKPCDISDILLASCLGKMTLKEVLDYIKKWCGMALNKYLRGHNKFVILVTDKWDDNIFADYSDEFRDLAMREDFWFIVIFKTRNTWLEIPFLPNAMFKPTRHISFEDGKIFYVESLPVDFFFEGIANFKTLPNDDPSVCVFLRNNKYCIISGTCYFSGKKHAAVTIGVWDGARRIYSALKAGFNPILCENGLNPYDLVEVAAHNPKILPIDLI